MQPNVASLPNAIDGGYITLAVAEGLRLENVSAQLPSVPPPPSVQLPWGVIRFQISGLRPGSATTAELILHGGSEPVAYWKFGPSATETPSPGWYEFGFDGETGALASDAQTLLIQFVDGGRGDSDLAANGVIDDPGGPAVQKWLMFLPRVTNQ